MSVTITDNHLIISDWSTNDQEIVRFFADIEDDQERTAGEKREEALTRALKIGVVALQRTETRVDLDTIRLEFNALKADLQKDVQERVQQLTKALDDVFAEDNGKLALALKDYLGEGGKLSDLFDPQRKDSAVGHIQAIFDQHFSGDGAKLVTLLDYTADGSPLKKLHQAIEGKFQELDEQLVKVHEKIEGKKARAEEAERGHGKGREYQKLVFDAIVPIAADFGDTPEDKADLADGCIPGCKKGDILVTLSELDTRGAKVRMVFEAKDGPTTLKRILDEMDEALRNREALVAVATYSRLEHMPTDQRRRKDGRYFADIGGKLFCLFDKQAEDDLPLQFAYRIARCHALQATIREAAIDIHGIKTLLEQAESQLANITNLQRSITTLKGSLDKNLGDMTEQLWSMSESLQDIFRQMDARIHASLDASMR